MSQEHDNKRAVLVLQNKQGYGAQRRSFTTEDEAWKSFLENPLTVATKAMMSINGDEDSAAALGFLYDYYEVPREKRTIPKTESLVSDVDPNKRHQIQARHPIVPLPEAGMENRIQVLKTPVNILQLAQDKTRAHFPSPDTTVTVSIATVPNYTPVKTEVPAHGFSVTVPNNCNETDSHVGVFERHLAQTVVQCNSSAPSRTPPDSTFSESFKDGSQEASVSILPSFHLLLMVSLLATSLLPSTSSLLSSTSLSSVRSLPSNKGIFTRSHGASGGLNLPWFLFEHAKIVASVLLCHCLTNTIKCCTFLVQ